MNVRFTYDLEGVTLHCFGTYYEDEYPGYPPSFVVDEVHVTGGPILFDVLYLLVGAGEITPLADVLHEAGMKQAMIDLESVGK